MTHSPLSSPKVALLVANGFDEIAFTTMQKLTLKQGGTTQVISSETAMVNGWAGSSWGCFYPVDAQLNTILASDFDALVIPGNKRSLERLAKTAHSRRILESFLNAEKPVLLSGGQDIYADILSADYSDGETLYMSEMDNMESFKMASVQFLSQIFGADTQDQPMQEAA